MNLVIAVRLNLPTCARLIAKELRTLGGLSQSCHGPEFQLAYTPGEAASFHGLRDVCPHDPRMRGPRIATDPLTMEEEED